MGDSASQRVLRELQQACPEGAVELESEALEAVLARTSRDDDLGAAASLLVVLDYDLTMSAAGTAECHHLLRDASALPEAPHVSPRAAARAGGAGRSRGGAAALRGRPRRRAPPRFFSATARRGPGRLVWPLPSVPTQRSSMASKPPGPHSLILLRKNQKRTFAIVV